VQVHRRVAALLDQRAQVAQQRRLARVGGLPVARRGDLVDADAGVPGGARVDRDPGLAAVVLGDGERDPLDRRQREAAVAEFGAEARVTAQRGGGAGEDAEEVRQLAARRHRALQHRKRPLGSCEVVVDLEPAHLSLHGGDSCSGRNGVPYPS
jgi:hypothetical protein